MKTKLLSALLLVGFIAGCGAKEKANEIKNEFNIRGHWILTEQTGSPARILENESMVLTFKDGKAAFSPTNSVKGRAAYALLSDCTKGPRPYRIENNVIVLENVTNCPEKRVAIQELNSDAFKCADPDKAEVIRTFGRIDEAKYHALVLPNDRKL